MKNNENLSTVACSMVINNTKTTNMSVTSKVSGDRVEVLFTIMFYAAACFIIYAGWCFREYELITAERGTGYYLGIIGVVLMLLLAVYPVRKRIRALAFLGSNKFWFRLHIVFGVVGPVFVIFHTNYDLGSLNSQVALFSMIIVALSGIAGRYIYVRFHYGLSARIVSLTELLDDLDQEKNELNINQLFLDIPEAKKKLFDFAETILTPSGSLASSFIRILVAEWRSKSIHWKMGRIIRNYLGNLSDGHELSFIQKKNIKRQFKKEISLFFTLTFRVLKFKFYERSFALWHLLHIPLVFLMAVAVVVHIIAVHLF